MPDNQIAFTPDLEREVNAPPNHWTFPNDPREQSGWGPFRTGWITRGREAFVKWHDKVTSQGSFAQRIRIPLWRINQGGEDMLRREARVSKRSWLGRRWNGLIGDFTSRVNRFFYEGPIDDKDDTFNAAFKYNEGIKDETDTDC